MSKINAKKHSFYHLNDTIDIFCKYLIKIINYKYKYSKNFIVVSDVFRPFGRPVYWFGHPNFQVFFFSCISTKNMLN